MKLLTAIRTLLRAEREKPPSSCEPSRARTSSSLWADGSADYPELNHAVFRHLLELGDCIEQGDEAGARTAMARAAAIEAELRSADHGTRSRSDRADAETMDDR